MRRLVRIKEIQALLSLLRVREHYVDRWLILTFFKFKYSHKPVLDAEIATPCGHTFCGFCVDTLKKSANISCAMCRQPVTMFIRNIFASKVLANLKCECCACGSQFILDFAKDHAKTCTEIEIGCSLCAEKIKRVNELGHSEVCPMRRVTCECGQVVTRREQNRNKESVCEFTKVGCPLKCGQEVERYV